MLYGNPGVVKPVGEGVREMKIDFGPGDRIYFVERADGSSVVLSCGDKDRQSRDIARAKALAQTV
jgi:putative addiction module killer protein